MGHFWLLPIFLVHISSFYKQINCQCGQTIQPKLSEALRMHENYLTPQIIFDQKSEIKTGELIECEVTNMKKLESTKADVHVLTQAGSHISDYIFYPASKDKKCFSFEVKTTLSPCVLLSVGPQVVDRLEVILATSGTTIIKTKDGKLVDSKPTPDIVNDKEFRGFWIRWLDDQLIEFGYDTQDIPLLSYRLPEKLSINYIGTLSFTAAAEWKIHSYPKCGKYNATEKIVAETKCKMLGKENLHKNNFVKKAHENNILENLQLHILNQMKNQHKNFKITKFRSKEILLEYQELIRKYFRNAEENQYQIYASDNEIYCPLKANTYNEIANGYFKFLEELQMELSVFKDTATTSENFISHGSGCCGCSTVRN